MSPDPEMRAELRCRPGDLALVVREEPGCERNIGRLIEVDGPLHHNQDLGLPCWLLRPVTSQPWCYTWDGQVFVKPIDWQDRIEIPDAWLIPVRRDDGLSLEEMESCVREQARMDQGLIEIGAVEPFD